MCNMTALILLMGVELVQEGADNDPDDSDREYDSHDFDITGACTQVWTAVFSVQRQDFSESRIISRTSLLGHIWENLFLHSVTEGEGTWTECRYHHSNGYSQWAS